MGWVGGMMSARCVDGAPHHWSMPSTTSRFFFSLVSIDPCTEPDRRTADAGHGCISCSAVAVCFSQMDRSIDRASTFASRSLLLTPRQGFV